VKKHWQAKWYASNLFNPAIDAGVEIVPVKSFADEMSSGVSYFEQFVWDLKNRGVADIDIPVMILGIDAD